jgi:hypothetical protein
VTPCPDHLPPTFPSSVLFASENLRAIGARHCRCLFEQTKKQTNKQPNHRPTPPTGVRHQAGRAAHRGGRLEQAGVHPPPRAVQDGQSVSQSTQISRSVGRSVGRMGSIQSLVHPLRRILLGLYLISALGRGGPACAWVDQPPTTPPRHTHTHQQPPQNQNTTITSHTHTHPSLFFA